MLVPLCSKDRADAFWGIRRHLLYVDPRTPNLQLDRLAEIMKPIAETRDRRLLPTPKFATGVIDVGAHGNNHLWLPRLSLSEMIKAIVESRRHCERLVRRRVYSFAYPFGAHDNNSRSAVRAAGFKSASAIKSGPVLPQSDKFALPQLRQSSRRTSNSRKIRVSPHDRPRTRQILRSYQPTCMRPQQPHAVFLTAD